MRIDITVRPDAGMPDPVEADHQAWACILDEIFADAFHAQLALLKVTLPHQALVHEVEMRAALSSSTFTGHGRGEALLAATEHRPALNRRLYVLQRSGPVPWFPQPVGKVANSHWPLLRQLSVYTWEARTLGIFLRLARLLNRTDLSERVNFTVKNRFTQSGFVPAHYHLSIWGEP